eukprot:scaffold26_cov159-Ochromonas_danica.AAC.5
MSERETVPFTPKPVDILRFLLDDDHNNALERAAAAAHTGREKPVLPKTAFSVHLMAPAGIANAISSLHGDSALDWTQCPPWQLTMQAKGPSLSSSSASRDGTSGVRVNKCLSHLSRRGADAAIAEGRVTVNGKIALAGQKVNFGDVVKLDGQLQRWEKTAKAKQLLPSTSPDNSLIYIKYFKPIGVTCTSDPNDPSNIIAKGKFHLFPQRLVGCFSSSGSDFNSDVFFGLKRLFTVGRLDKDSCGLILLTSDGRVNEALLHR